MIFLFECAPINPATGVATTYRFASLHALGDGTLLDSKEWEPAIVSAPQTSATYFSGGLVQQASNDYASISLQLTPATATLSQMGWDGATGRVWVGSAGQPFTSYRKIFEGTLGAQSREADRLKIPLYGLDFKLNDTNVLTSTYAGTGGAEGPVELKGAWKPRAYGVCRYVTPQRVDKAYVVYQVHDGAVTDISAVYENALALSAPVATVSSYAALCALTLAPGTWAKAPAVGMFRLGSEPSGKLTADVTGDSAAGTSLASISTALLRAAGVSASDIDSSVASVAGSLAWNLYLTDQATVGATIKSAFASAFCYLSTNALGKVQAGSWLANGATITVGTGDSDFAIIPQSLRQEEASPPNYSVTVNAERCWSVHNDSEVSPAIYDLQASDATISAAATAARAVADQAAANILIEKARTDAIVSDSVLDRSEKAQVKLAYAGIVSDYAKYSAQASGYGLSTTAYTTAYNALASYLNGLSPAWNDLSADTSIVRSAFDTAFQNERVARTNIIAATADATSKLANWPQITGANKPADNATVGAQAGVNLKDSGGAVLADNAIKNLAVTIGADGTIIGIGSTGVQVDNTKQQWTNVLSRPTDLTSLNYGEGTKLATIQQNADKTSLNTAAYVANQSEWVTTTVPISGYKQPPNNLIYNSTGRFGLDRWTASPASAWSGTLSYSGYQIAVSPSSAGTHTLLSDYVSISGGQTYFFAIEDVAYWATATYKFLAYDPNNNRVPADDISISGIGGSNGFGRTGVQVTNIFGSRRYRLLITYVAPAAGQYYIVRNIKFEQSAVGTPWNDASSNGAVYADFKSIDALKPAEIGANITENRTALNVYGQGALATRDDVRAGLNLKDSSGAILTDNAIRNFAITIGADGTITNIGTSGVVVDNTKQQWTQVLSRPTDLSGLDSTAATKLGGIAAGATVGAQAGVNLKDSGGTTLGDAAIKNSAVSLSAGGVLSGAGGGAVTIGGLGYTGALNATYGADLATNVTNKSLANLDASANTKLTSVATGATRNDDTGNMLEGGFKMSTGSARTAGANYEDTGSGNAARDRWRLRLDSANSQYDLQATLIPVSGDETLWLQGWFYSASAGGTASFALDFFNAGGAGIAHSFGQINHTNVGGAGWFKRTISGVVPSGASFCKPTFFRDATGGGNFYLAEPLVSRQQPGADVTAQSQHNIVAAVTALDFAADYTNTLLSGQISKSVAVKRQLGTTDVTASTTWTLTATAGITASINSAGLVSFAAVANGAVIVTGTYGGVALQVPIAISRTQGAAPVGGGSGATSASTTAISAATSTSYVTGVSGTLTLAAGSSGTVNLTAGVDFYISGTSSSNQSQGCYGKWQWRVSGGTFADVTSEVGSSYNAFRPGTGTYVAPTIDTDAQASDGRIDVNQSKTGLTSGSTYEFRFVWRLSGGGPSVQGVGSFYAVQA